MLNCHDLTCQATDYLEGRMSWMARLQFRMHLSMCAHCNRFLRYLRISIGATRTLGAECASDDEIRQVLAHIRAAERAAADSR
jgi:hypothetical protein